MHLFIVLVEMKRKTERKTLYIYKHNTIKKKIVGTGDGWMSVLKGNVITKYHSRWVNL